MSKHCPYCDAPADNDIGWYFECENGHTFHMDDWSLDELEEGVTV